MKILHTADWHIGDKKGPSLNGVNLRAQDTLNCLNELVRVAKEEKPDLVLVSGDITDTAGDYATEKSSGSIAGSKYYLSAFESSRECNCYERNT